MLWTVRNGEELVAAVDWCGERGLHFCNVNGPAPSNEAEYKGRYERESRKIYADVYIDDHNLEFGFSQTRTPIESTEILLERLVDKCHKKEN